MASQPGKRVGELVSWPCLVGLFELPYIHVRNTKGEGLRPRPFSFFLVISGASG